MGYTLISFDLDGTLVDTAAEIAEAANRTLAELGLPRRTVPDITRLIGHGAQALMRQLLAQALAQPPQTAPWWTVDAALRSFDIHYAQTVGSLATPYPGALQTLQRLRRHGLKLACVTNKELRHAQHVLRTQQLDGCFDLLIGGDSLPEQKPHASVLRTVVRQLGCTLGSTAHVGDSATDVAAARNAGVSAWAVPHGYNAGRPIQDSRPDKVFAQLDAIADHVLSQGCAEATAWGGP